MSVFPVYPSNAPIPLRDWLNMSADILGAPASLLHALILMTDKLLPITTTHMLDNRTKHSTRNAPCPREISSSCLHSISRTLISATFVIMESIPPRARILLICCKPFKKRKLLIYINILQKPMPRECITLTGGEHISVLLEQTR